MTVPPDSPLTDPAAAPPLVPKLRARGVLSGPTFTACDQTWQLPFVLGATSMDKYRDQIFDESFRKEVTLQVILEAAFLLLDASYDLTEDELARILREAPRVELVGAVIDALLGPTDGMRTYSNWLRAGLKSNGLLIKDVRPEELGALLGHLNSAGKLMPLEAFLQSAYHHKRKQQLLEMVD